MVLFLSTYPKIRAALGLVEVHWASQKKTYVYAHHFLVSSKRQKNIKNLWNVAENFKFAY